MSVLGNCFYFPADSVVLPCCVMLGRDCLTFVDWMGDRCDGVWLCGSGGSGSLSLRLFALMDEG